MIITTPTLIEALEMLLHGFIQPDQQLTTSEGVEIKVLEPGDVIQDDEFHVTIEILPQRRIRTTFPGHEPEMWGFAGQDSEAQP